MSNQLDRRQFTKAGVAAAGIVATGIHSRVESANIDRNETIGVGFVGVGNRGQQLLNAFSQHDDCKIVAAADVFQPYLDRFQKEQGSHLYVTNEYRNLLDRADIDAIVVATPDHWHALQTINAVSAGKDVYVEKPLAATIVEGQRIVKAAEKFGRVVQVGLQRRSMDSYQRLREFIQDDGAGQITVSRAYRLNNMFPDGMGRRQPASPPAGLNWDRWLGPRQEQPYQDNIAPYKFRWWQNYSSQMGNWGVHYFDVIRWILGEAAPQSAVCIGGNYAIDDDRTIPDTAEAIFELPGGSLLVFGQYEASSTSMLDWGELELRGTMGTVHGASSGFRVLPEKPGQFQKKGPRAEPHEVATTPADATADHVRDFLDCVKSRKQPRCPLIEGHRSTLFAHMANISLATGQRLTWDSEAEIFVNNKQANDLLHYEYRKGYVLPEFD